MIGFTPAETAWVMDEAGFHMYQHHPFRLVVRHDARRVVVMSAYPDGGYDNSMVVDARWLVDNYGQDRYESRMRVSAEVFDHVWQHEWQHLLDRMLRS